MALDLSISYLGWSGFRIDRQGGTPIFIDPDARADLPLEGPIVILLTHGHPEHLGGTRAYLERAGARADATILASRSVCRHLSCRSAGNVTLKPVSPGARLTAGDGVELSVFEWQHLPLLPPGIGPGILHVAQVLTRPLLAFRIAWAGLTGPRSGPMLGYRIDLGGWEVQAYGEGLHRFSKPERGRGRGDRTILLAGIEPGDESSMPDLIRACGAGSAILYEPHARWRQAFGMERAKLAHVRERLDCCGISATIAEPGRPDLF